MWKELCFKDYNIWKYYCLGKDKSAISIRKYKKEKCYSGSIYCQEYSLTRRTLTGYDIDIIKLECLLAAKDLGWAIHSVA